MIKIIHLLSVQGRQLGIELPGQLIRLINGDSASHVHKLYRKCTHKIYPSFELVSEHFAFEFLKCALKQKDYLNIQNACK